MWKGGGMAKCCELLERAIYEGFIIETDGKILIGGCSNDGIEATFCPFCGKRFG